MENPVLEVVYIVIASLASPLVLEFVRNLFTRSAKAEERRDAKLDALIKQVDELTAANVQHLVKLATQDERIRAQDVQIAEATRQNVLLNDQVKNQAQQIVLLNAELKEKERRIKAQDGLIHELRESLNRLTEKEHARE